MTRRAPSLYSEASNAGACSNLLGPEAPNVTGAYPKGSFSVENIAGWRRDSQRLQKCRISLNYGKQKKLLAAELKLADKYGPSVRKILARTRPGSTDEYIEARVIRKAEKEAQKIIDTYFKRIPGVKRFIDTVHMRAAKDKYVESILGRRRWLHQIMDVEEQLEHEKLAFEQGREACWCARCRDSRAGDRRSVNTIIQGSAADVTMMAMLKCHADPDLSCVNMLFQVHDEINFEVPEEIADECSERIKAHMENPGIDLRVPLKAEPALGNNWVEAH